MLRSEFNKSDGCRIFTVSVAIILIINFVLALFGRAWGIVDEKGNIVGVGFWIVSALLQIAMFLCAFIFSKVTKTDFLVATKIKSRPKFLPVLLACVVGIGVFCAVSPLQIWLLGWLESVGYVSNSSIPLSTDVGNVVLLFLVVAIMPAICEEVLFRGVIANGFAQKGLVFACLTNGLLFSVFHLSPAQTLHQFIMGFLLTLFVLKTKSILPAVLVHLFNNVITLCLTLSLGEEQADLLVGQYWYLFLFVGLAVVAVGLFFFLKTTKGVTIAKTADEPSDEAEQEKEVEKIDAEHIRPKKEFSQDTSDRMILIGGIAVCLIFWFSALIS